jgi:hypothetical protein
MTKRRRPPPVLKIVDLTRCPALSVQLTAYGFAEIAKQITAERKAWRKALGVPQGFEIPEKPLPKTEEECLAELEAVMRKESEVLKTVFSGMPPGPEYESAGLHMVVLRDRRWELECALKELGSRTRKPK